MAMWTKNRKGKRQGKRNRNPDRGDVQLSRDKEKKKRREKSIKRPRRTPGADAVVVVVRACPRV